MFGTRLTQGGEEADKIKKWIEAGSANVEAQALFSEGSRRCKESGGSVEIDPAKEEIQVETLEQLKERREARHKSKRIKIHGQPLDNVKSEVYPVQSGWAACSSPEDRQAGFTNFRPVLKERGFKDVELIALHGVAETSRFACRISGIYYRMSATLNGRPCFQKLLHAPASSMGTCCDGIYIMWNSGQSRWQVSTKPQDDAPCIAYYKGDQLHVKEVSGPWRIQQQGTSDFAEGTIQILTE
jgi:hypothetical protein